MVGGCDVGFLGCSRECLWGAHGCSWWVGTMLGSWGAPGGACGVLVRHEMVHHLAKGRTWVLMDVHGVLMGAHGVLIWCAMVHHSARGRLFGQGEGGGEVSDEDERENAMESLNKPSHVQGVSTSCQMQPFSTWQGT